jgi:hypothetical protein
VPTQLTTEQLHKLSRAELSASIGVWGAGKKLVSRWLLCTASSGNATALFAAERAVGEAEDAAAAVDDEAADAVEQQAEAVEQLAEPVEQQAARCEPLA